MIVIPAVDIMGGRAVRLRQGLASEATDFGDPVEAALRWKREGAEYLHVVDLDGAFTGRPANIEVVKKIIRAVGIPVEVGGGIRTTETVDELLAAGADRVIIGTKAVESIDWVRKLIADHPNRVAIGIDVKDGLIATRGWVDASGVGPAQLLELLSGSPVAAYIYTDVSRDGLRGGPNLAATRSFASSTTVPVIASGGVSSLDDLRSLALAGFFGAIVGRALYDGAFTLGAALAAARVSTAPPK